MAKAPIQIKRYPNRRFYDCNASAYIALADIERLVREGHDVEIKESQSGDDITRSVLTRIISERQPEKMLLFPTEMLHFILRGNEVTSNFLRDYFQHSLTYLDYLSRHTPTANALASPVHWVKAWLDGISKSRHEAEEDSSDNAFIHNEEALRLARRVEQLEKRLQQLESQGQR